MKHYIICFISMVVLNTMVAQTYEIGVFFGGSNFIGDVGATNYVNPNKMAYGAIFKWNQGPRYAFRGSIMFSQLGGYDDESDDPRRRARDYSFELDVIEFSVGLEFNFLDFDLHELGFKHTPYVYTGISTTNHGNYYYSRAGVFGATVDGEYIDENTNSWAYGIPMVLGYKAKITEKFILGAEIGARYTFSDELDGSVPDLDGLNSPLAFGNTNSNDWYVFSGITLTYTFGRKPCYTCYK